MAKGLAKKEKNASKENNEEENQEASNDESEVRLPGNWWINSADGLLTLGYKDTNDSLLLNGFAPSSIDSFDRMTKKNGEYVNLSTFIKVNLKYDDVLPDRPIKTFVLHVDKFRKHNCDGVFKGANLSKRRIVEFIELFEENQPEEQLTNKTSHSDEDEETIEDEYAERSRKGKLSVVKKNTVDVPKSDMLVKSAEFVQDLPKFDTDFVQNDPAVKEETKRRNRAKAKEDKPLTKAQQYQEELEASEKEFNRLTNLHYLGHYNVCVDFLAPANPLHLDKVTTDAGVLKLKNQIKMNPHRLRLMSPLVCYYDGNAHKFLSDHVKICAQVEKDYPVDGPEPPPNVPQTGADVGKLTTLGGNHRLLSIRGLAQDELKNGLTYKEIAEKYHSPLIRVNCTVYAKIVKDPETKTKSTLSDSQIKRLAAEDNKLPPVLVKTWFDDCKNLKRMLLHACNMSAGDLRLTISKRKLEKYMETTFKEYCFAEYPEAVGKSERSKRDKTKVLASLHGDRFRDLMDIEKICNDIVLEQFRSKARTIEKNNDGPKMVDFITMYYVGTPLAKLPEEMRGMAVVQLRTGLSSYITNCKEKEASPTVRGLRMIFNAFTSYCEKEAVHHDFRMAFGAYVKLKTYEEVCERFPEYTNPLTYQILLETDSMLNKNAKFLKIENIPQSWKDYFQRAVDWYTKEKRKKEEANDEDDVLIDDDKEDINKNSVLRNQVCGSVIALKKLNYSLASHLRPDELDFAGISTYLVSDLSTQENGQTMIDAMSQMSHKLGKFVIICLNDTPSQLDAVFDLQLFTKKLLYIGVTDMTQSSAPEVIAGYTNNAKFVTLLVGGKKERKTSHKRGKSCVFQAKSLLDPLLWRKLVESVTDKGQWVFDSVSGRTEDPLLLAKLLLHSYSRSNLHMFLDVSFIPDYAKRCDGWYETLQHQILTINIAAEEEIARRSRKAVARVGWIDEVMHKAFPICDKDEEKGSDFEESDDDDADGNNSSGSTENVMDESGHTAISPRSPNPPVDNEDAAAGMFFRSNSKDANQKDDEDDITMPNETRVDEPGSAGTNKPQNKTVDTAKLAPSLQNTTPVESGSAGTNISQTSVDTTKAAPSMPTATPVESGSAGTNISQTSVDTTKAAPSMPTATPVESGSAGTNISQTSVDTTKAAPSMPTATPVESGSAGTNFAQTSVDTTKVAPSLPTATPVESGSAGTNISQTSVDTTKAAPSMPASSKPAPSLPTATPVESGSAGINLSQSQTSVDISNITSSFFGSPRTMPLYSEFSKNVANQRDTTEEITSSTPKSSEVNVDSQQTTNDQNGGRDKESTSTPNLVNVDSQQKTDDQNGGRDKESTSTPSPEMNCDSRSGSHDKMSRKRIADVDVDVDVTSVGPSPDTKRMRFETSNMVQPDRELSSRFPPFSPTSREWQIEKCDTYQFKRNKTIRFHPSEESSIHDVVPSKHFLVEPDGNCLFRCLSVVLRGSQTSHERIRADIIEYMRTHSVPYGLYIGKEIEDYLEESEMAELTTWASEVEIQVAADLFKTDIYTFAANGDKQWSRFYARNDANSSQKLYDGKIDENYQAIYIRHTGDHYDVVRGVIRREESSECKKEQHLLTSIQSVIDISRSTEFEISQPSVEKENNMVVDEKPKSHSHISTIDKSLDVTLTNEEYQSSINESYVKLPRRKVVVEQFIIKPLPTTDWKSISSQILTENGSRSKKSSRQATSTIITRSNKGGERMSSKYRKVARELVFDAVPEHWKNHKFPNDSTEY